MSKEKPLEKPLEKSFNTKTKPEKEQELIELLNSKTPGMVAKALANGRDTVDQYLEYLGVERAYVDRQLKRRDLRYNFFYANASDLARKCYYLNDNPEKNMVKGKERSLTHYAAHLRVVQDKFWHTTTLLKAAVSVAQEHFKQLPLSEEEIKKFDKLTPEELEKTRNTLELAQMYGAYIGYKYNNLKPDFNNKAFNYIKSSRNEIISRNLMQVIGDQLMQNTDNNLELIAQIETNLHAVRITDIKLNPEHKFASLVMVTPDNYMHTNKYWSAGIDLAKLETDSNRHNIDNAPS